VAVVLNCSRAKVIVEVKINLPAAKRTGRPVTLPWSLQWSVPPIARTTLTQRPLPRHVASAVNFRTVPRRAGAK